MENSNKNPLDKKKFLIQILVAIGISVLFQLVIDPVIYDPFIRDRMGGFLEPGDAIVICSMSMWFFSFSLTFFIYRTNEIINNYLLCAFIPLAIIVGFEFATLFFIDFLHIPPVIIIVFIIWKHRSTFQLKKVAIASVVLIIWATTVRLIGTNYTGLPLFPHGLVAVIGWPLLNILLAYILIRTDRTRVK